MAPISFGQESSIPLGVEFHGWTPTSGQKTWPAKQCIFPRGDSFSQVTRSAWSHSDLSVSVSAKSKGWSFFLSQFNSIFRRPICSKRPLITGSPRISSWWLVRHPQAKTPVRLLPTFPSADWLQGPDESQIDPLID